MFIVLGVQSKPTGAPISFPFRSPVKLGRKDKATDVEFDIDLEISLERE